MLEMSWITAILQLYSQVAGLFGNVIVKRIHIRLFDLLARFHYILNLPRMPLTDVNKYKFLLFASFSSGTQLHSLYRFSRDTDLVKPVTIRAASFWILCSEFMF